MATGAHEITQGLIDWAKSALPDAQVAARGSREAPADEAVEIRLMGIAPHAPPRVAYAPAELALDYLIAIRTADPLEEHRLAAELMFAALEQHDLVIVTDRSPLEAAAALGLPPAAGLVVRVVLSRARAKPRTQLVRFPLKPELTGVGRVEGVVLGPKDTPITGAVITLPGLNRTARTGADGRFLISGPLPDTVPVRVIARARGVQIEAMASPGEPAVLHLPLET